MRWHSVVLALLVGGLSAVAWFLPRYQPSRPAPSRPAAHHHHDPPSRPAGKPPGLLAPAHDGEIPLTVEHKGPALALRWRLEDRAQREADQGKLTITDGTHESRLKLDVAELRSGAALYWPQASRVGFRLETGGAQGSLEVPVWEVAQDEPLPAAQANGPNGNEQRPTAARPTADRKTGGPADRGARSGKTARAKHPKHAGEKPAADRKTPRP